jgi:hypothetical protein
MGLPGQQCEAEKARRWAKAMLPQGIFVVLTGISIFFRKLCGLML